MDSKITNNELIQPVGLLQKVKGHKPFFGLCFRCIACRGFQYTVLALKVNH